MNLLNRRRTIIILLLVVSIVSVCALVFFTYFVPSNKMKIIVEIPQGLGLREIASKLEESGVIKSDMVFISYAIIKGDGGRLQAGEYEFYQGDSIPRVLEKLVEGDVIVRIITIPEGMTVIEIAALLEKKGVMPKQDFIEKATNIELTKELLGEPVSSFEGYLFPETYFYKKGIAAEKLIQLMVHRFKNVWRIVRTSRNEDISLTDHEIVTLASIVEEETGDPSERYLISEVFHNRLNRGMRLESDPTVIYALGDDFDGDLTKDELKTDSAYNTYLITGLPPGPITNPGKASLIAALSPTKFNYLYFVSKGNGTHEFSSSYIDHLKAVNKYQKNSKHSNGKTH